MGDREKYYFLTPSFSSVFAQKGNGALVDHDGRREVQFRGGKRENLVHLNKFVSKSDVLFPQVLKELMLVIFWKDA